jgi:hypothetical protein
METIATHHVVMNVTESKYIEEWTRIKFRVSQKQAIFFLQMRMNMADYIVYMVNPTKLLKESIEDRLHETPFITLENK